MPPVFTLVPASRSSDASAMELTPPLSTASREVGPRMRLESALADYVVGRPPRTEESPLSQAVLEYVGEAAPARARAA